MYFPGAGIELNPLNPPLMMFAISIFTSMGGVSGAFLLLPIQISLFGFTSPAVSSTNQLYNIFSIPSGLYNYIKEGRMVWQLAYIVIFGTLPGVFIGTIIRVKYLPDPKNFKLFAGFVLLYIGSRLGKDLIKRFNKKESGSSEARFQELMKSYKHGKDPISQKLPRVQIEKFNFSKLAYEFLGERYTVSVPIVFSISAVVGIVGGIYGIGGGAIMAPIFVAMFNLPVYTIAGAALLGTFITSVAAVGFYHAIAPFFPGMQVSPDWLLGFLFGIGGFTGIFCGARLQKYFPATFIKWMLACCILFISLNYICGFFLG